MEVVFVLTKILTLDRVTLPPGIYETTMWWVLKDDLSFTKPSVYISIVRIQMQPYICVYKENIFVYTEI